MGRIKNPGLAAKGRAAHAWARSHMPVLDGIIRERRGSRPLDGLTVGFCLQMTAETSVLLAGAAELGARVVASSGNPLTTQDNVAAFVASTGADVYAWSGQTVREFGWCVRRVLMHRPDIVTDDGAELSLLAHTDPAFAGTEILGGTEETATGVRRISALSAAGGGCEGKGLRYPVIAVNDAGTKRLFDNRYGTGQSTVDGFLRSANLLVAAKRVVVAGYGWVGRGVAARFRALGARVAVTEVDPVRALEACMDGYEVMRMGRAARIGDVFVTCTGMAGVITPAHIDSMRDGAVVLNVGHSDTEADAGYLLGRAGPGGRRGRFGRGVRPGLDECVLENGRRIYLASRGRVANLAAAEGHPPEVMDQSFSCQLLSILHIAKNHGMLPRRVIGVPPTVDACIARGVLSAAGIRTDA